MKITETIVIKVTRTTECIEQCFDEKLKEKKYYNEIAIQTIELLKIAIHRKTYDEKKLVGFVSKVVNFSKQFKSMETAKRYYGFNTMVLYNFIDRTGEKKNGCIKNNQRVKHEAGSPGYFYR